jgi:hypothetical protein
MDMDPFLIWLQETALSTWVRESTSMFAFPGILTLHTIGMAFLVGTTAAFSLRVIGFAPRVPVEAMLRFAPVVWFGLVVNTVSGIVLLMGYPAKALTNPVFYLKLGCIALALIVVRALGKRILNPEPRHRIGWNRNGVLATATLGLWVVSVTAGRMLAYTASQLMAGE